MQEFDVPQDPSRPMVWSSGLTASDPLQNATVPAPGSGLRELEIGARTFRAVLVDLDGTLLTSSGQVSPRTQKAIAAVQRRGVHVMVVTGRSVSSAENALQDVPLETPIVCYNGGSLYCTRRRELLRHEVLGARLVATLTRRLHEAGLDFFLNRGDEKLTMHGKHPQYDEAVGSLIDVRWIEDLEQLPCDRVARITILGPPEAVKAERQRLLAEYYPSIYVESFFLAALPSHREFTSLFVCDVHPPSLGKAEAIRYLEEEIGIPRDDVVAIGDGKNDLSMLRAAGLALAMANSHEDVLAQAERVLPHHDEDGVASFLEETFLS